MHAEIASSGHALVSNIFGGLTPSGIARPSSRNAGLLFSLGKQICD
jgi:hypothetical protein